MTNNIFTIAGQSYVLQDTKEKITIADSFVVRANKIGVGNGEAKLYIGNTNDTNDEFFGANFKELHCFMLKSDLIKYLNETKPEYDNPEQPYVHAAELRSKWGERLTKVAAFDDVINFVMTKQDQIAGPRMYVKSNDEAYELIRELSLPNITYIAILKLQNAADEYVYYVRLFADFFGEVTHPGRIRKVEEDIKHDDDLDTQEKVQARQARKGQGPYREKVLSRCSFCPITMISDERILIASHIKPWAMSNEQEQVDPFNGFMLTPTYDYLFDKGFITFTDDKRIILSPFLSNYTYGRLNLSPNTVYSRLAVEGSELYLKFHRENIFKGIG